MKKGNKKKIFIVIAVMLIIVLLAGFVGTGIYLFSNGDFDFEFIQKASKDDSESSSNGKSNSKGTKTVMIYMCGADLESEGGIASLNLKDLQNSKIDYDNINIVLCAGGAKKWHTKEISETETSIFEINEKGLNKVKKQSKLDMGSKSTVTSFLDYVYDNYKSNEYYFMFWNHGAALAGLEQDELSGNMISLSDLNKCLNNSKFNKNNKKFDLLIFNNCLMGSIETANIASNYADYLVTSEDVMYGDEMIKTFKFLDGITVKNSATDIGKSYIDCYINSIVKAGADLNVTMSLIDLSKIKDVTDNLDEYFKNIKLDGELFKKISKLRSNQVYEYQKASNVYDMVDLQELTTKLSSVNSDNKDLLNSINKAVIYNKSNDRHSNGLSIYFPETYDWSEVYNGFTFASDYKKFLKNYIGYIEGKKNVKFAMNDKEIQKSGKEFSIQLTDEESSIYRDSEFLIYEDNGDGTYSRIVNFPNADVSDKGLVTANYDKKIIAVEDSTDGSIFELGNLAILEKNDDYILYGLPIILEKKKEQTEFSAPELKNAMMILKSKNDGSIEVVKTIDWKTDNQGRAATNGTFVDIYNGDYTKIYFTKSKVELELDANGNYVGIGKIRETGGREISLENKFTFKKVDLDTSKKYVGVFFTSDVYGNTYYSKLVDIEL